MSFTIEWSRLRSTSMPRLVDSHFYSSVPLGAIEMEDPAVLLQNFLEDAKLDSHYYPLLRAVNGSNQTDPFILEQMNNGCPICHNAYAEYRGAESLRIPSTCVPVELPCKHIFGHACLVKDLQTTNGPDLSRKACGLCRQEPGDLFTSPYRSPLLRDLWKRNDPLIWALLHPQWFAHPIERDREIDITTLLESIFEVTATCGAMLQYNWADYQHRPRPCHRGKGRWLLGDEGISAKSFECVLLMLVMQGDHYSALTGKQTLWSYYQHFRPLVREAFNIFRSIEMSNFGHCCSSCEFDFFRYYASLVSVVALHKTDHLTGIFQLPDPWKKIPIVQDDLAERALSTNSWAGPLNSSSSAEPGRSRYLRRFSTASYELGSASFIRSQYDRHHVKVIDPSQEDTRTSCDLLALSLEVAGLQIT